MENSKQGNDKTRSKSETSSVEYGKFTGNYKNDGISGEFDGSTYSHSKEMSKVYKIFILYKSCALTHIHNSYRYRNHVQVPKFINK